MVHAVILVGTALSKHMGPGAAFSSSCPHVPSVVVSGERERDSEREKERHRETQTESV